MNWNQVLTKLKKTLGFKKKMPIGGAKPEHEPIAPVRTIEEAVDSIPEDLLDKLKDYSSVKGNHSKLTEEQQLELMEFIARYATMDEINEHFVQKHKTSISQPLVYQYKRTKKWQPIILKLREKYLLNPSEVAMSHKRVRLDRRERIYQKAMHKEDLKTALSSVQGSKEEMEESRGGISLTFNQYNSLSDEEVKEQISEKLKLLGNNVIEVKNESA